MKRSILLIILVVLSCTVLSGCGTIVKEVKQATPVNTVDADAEDTSEEKTIDQKAEKPETITEYESVTEQENEIIMVMTINDKKVKKDGKDFQHLWLKNQMR